MFQFRGGYVKGHSADAMAFAFPYAEDGPCVTVLIDRLKQEVARNPDTTGILLGHVLAHEIGHVLQRIDRHSDSGLMKARWSVGDIVEMKQARLRFTLYDAQSILGALGLLHRE